MSDTDEIIVEIEGEAGGTPAVETETKKQNDPVAELQAQLEARTAETERERAARDAERQRADAEAQRRAEAEKAAETARSEVADSRLSTVEQGLAAAQTEAGAAEAAYTQAMEAGNWAEAAKQQRRMARAEAEAVRLNEAKADLEVAKAAPPVERRTEERTETRHQPADPVETYLAAVGRQFPKSAEWLRAHPDEARVMATNSDPRKVAKINAAHQDALAEGHAIDTAGYFEHVEKFLGMTKVSANGAGNGAGNGAQRPQAQRRPAAPVAPVAQAAGTINGGGTEVRLTKGEATAATDGTHVWNYDDSSGQKRFKKGDPIGVQEFARRKKAMQEQGLYDKTFVEQ